MQFPIMFNRSIDIYKTQSSLVTESLPRNCPSPQNASGGSLSE